ncbi:MIF4G like-domain-containing protein [Sporodiniella umbellata]|nr:MIF4G like-domain-containing protein [Sporodiniella umbellata]
MSYENRGYRPRQEGGRHRHGGRGGNYNRRDDRRNYNHRGPYERPPERSKEDELEDIEIRLKGLIIKIGDKFTPELQVNLTKMRNILDNDYSKYPDTVQNTLAACVCELPAKAPIYGTLIGLLNVSRNDIVAKLMAHFNMLFTNMLAESNWFKVKQFLRFYGELVNANVVTPTAYANLLLEVLADLDETNQLCKRLDSIVYTVLSTLPWCARELNERSSHEFDQILRKIEIYMQRRDSSNRLKLLSSYSDERFGDRKEEPLTHIWSLIQELQGKSWKLSLIPKPYRWFDVEFSSALQHELPKAILPAHQDSTEYLTPAPTFKMLVNDEGVTLPVVPQHDSIEYFILQELMADTIFLYEVNRKDCAKYLLNLPHNCEARYFKRSSDSDEPMEEDEDEEEPGWSISDLLVETVFAHMLRLPSSDFRQVFYASVIIELCRVDGSKFPMALGRGVKTLYDRLDKMDVECINRLYSWFSHHLSNFGFQWDWQAWEGAITMNPLSQQFCFLKEVLEKEIRLSYYDRIKSMLPENFHIFLSESAPSPQFKYSDKADPSHEKSKTIIDSLRTKKNVEEVREMLSKYKDEAASEGKGEVEQQSYIRELFVQSLLLVGSKSFSHILNVVERYLDVLRFLNSTPEGRLHTVQILASFWEHNTQFMCILLDKLLNYRVIDPTSVITWVFEENQLKYAGRSFIWEILKNTLGKVNSRVTQVKSKLDSLQSVHETNKAKRAELEATEMTEAEEQQELDSIRIVENSLATVTRERKEVFLLVCQKFVGTLKSIDTTAPDQALIFWWVSGWYKEILRVNYKECKGFIATLETLVFTPDLDERILDIFYEAKKLTEQDDLLV